MRVLENAVFYVIFSLFENTHSAAEGCRKSTVGHAKTTFVAHPSGTILGAFSVVFSVCFCYVFEEVSGAGFYCFWHHFDDILGGIW